MDNSLMHIGKERERIVRFLMGGPARLEPSANPLRPLLRLADGGTVSIARAEAEKMVREALLRRETGMLALTETGIALARRSRAQQKPFLEQHAELGSRRFDTGEVLINTAESPLSKLAQRRNRDGEKFLSPREFRAGERLRSDYTRGQILPGLGGNWDVVVPGRRQGRAQSGASDLTDAALAARQRVELALDAAGPELSGVLIDVCCFLKGLERIESERGWPVRSAKIVLKTALSVLARHYEPEQRPSKRPRVLHWGAEDYRPTIAG